MAVSRQTAHPAVGPGSRRWSWPRLGAGVLAAVRARDPLLVALLFGLALWQFLPGVTATPFHRDEARWIHRAYYLREWADPFGPRWQDEGYPGGRSWDERHRMRAQPPLGSYLVGLGLLVQGRDLSTNGFWNMDRDDAWNAAQGNLPAGEDLAAGRRTNAVVAALTVVAAYALGRRLTNRAGGVAAALVFAVHPLSRDTAGRAWADPLATLLVALAAVAAYRLADRPTPGRALLLGVLLGLGGATKLSPLLVAPVLALLGAALLLHQWLRRGAVEPGEGGRRRALALHLLGVPLVAVVTFVASYPYLWPDPVGQTVNLFAFRAQSFAFQGRAWPNAAVETRTEALGRVGMKLGTEFTIGGRFGLPPATRGLELLLAVAGALVLVALVVRYGLASGQALLAAVLAGQVGVTLGAMGVDFARYHLPIVLAVAVCVGVLVGEAWAWLGAGLGSMDCRGVKNSRDLEVAGCGRKSRGLEVAGLKPRAKPTKSLRD